MFFAVDDGIRDLRIFHPIGGIEHAEFEPGGEQTFDGGIDLVFR